MREPPSSVRSDHSSYTTPHLESVEDEVGRLIISLIDVIKANHVVELGTHEGYLAQQIGVELVEQGQGVLNTFEIDRTRARIALDRCQGLPVKVHVADCSTVDLDDFWKIDILIVDAHLDNRATDYLRWRQCLSNDGIAIIHDTLKYDPPCSQISQLADDKIWLRTPRGVTIVQP